MNKVKNIVDLERGKRFAKFRSKKYRSKKKFAEFLGVSTTTISDIEKGIRVLTDNFKEELAKKYDEKSFGWFDTGEGEMPKLLTEYNTINTFQIAKEDNIPINKKCLNCEQKDKEIKNLLIQLVDAQHELNECRKEVLALKKQSFG